MCKKIKQNYLLDKYKETFEGVPIDKLSSVEKPLVHRCLNDDKDFTDNELAILKKVIEKYGGPVKDLNAKELLTNTDQLMSTIKTEQQLLDLVEKEKEGRDLKVNLPFRDGIHPVTFTVLPPTDSRAIQTMMTHTELFTDFNDKERKIYNKGQEDRSKLNKVEKEVYDNLVQRIMKKTNNDWESTINELLTYQLTIKGRELNREVNRKIWENMNIFVKTAICFKVKDILDFEGMDSEDLFPAAN